MNIFQVLSLFLTVELVSSFSPSTVATINKSGASVDLQPVLKSNLLRVSKPGNGRGGNRPHDEMSYLDSRQSSLVCRRVASGETPEEFMADKKGALNIDNQDQQQTQKKQQVASDEKRSSINEIPLVVYQVGAGLCIMVVAFVALNAMVDTVSHAAAGAGHALGSEILRELGNLLGFVGSLVVALFELLKVVIPAVGKGIFAFGKAAAPVVAEKSQQLSDVAAPYAAKATQVVSDAAAPYVQEVTSTVETTVVQPLQQAVDANVVSPLQSAQEGAKASVEATIQGVQDTVSMQVNNVQNSVTSQVGSSIQGVQDTVSAQMNNVQNSVTSQVGSSLQSAQKQVEQILP
eukprot:CAMPEP_0113499314 /NCGR_PEP_ID=MMETSP0014_2-20120614/31679_1 /TAXON_ID=2857 /ORGANISM="Nitzschia sp." /LENGTH=346 /DNA_ID=CAMNT_0000393475 /DNA_START=40 /DNA_END=1080 /DNA_ORIENTATION=- /assembly_acc=CAM_ASM_000159